MARTRKFQKLFFSKKITSALGGKTLSMTGFYYFLKLFIKYIFRNQKMKKMQC